MAERAKLSGLPRSTDLVSMSARTGGLSTLATAMAIVWEVLGLTVAGGKRHVVAARLIVGWGPTERLAEQGRPGGQTRGRVRDRITVRIDGVERKRQSLVLIDGLVADRSEDGSGVVLGHGDRNRLGILVLAVVNRERDLVGAGLGGAGGPGERSARRRLPLPAGRRLSRSDRWCWGRCRGSSASRSGPW